MAVAIVLLLGAATLAAAGCGFGAGATLGRASLTVTRDFGSEALVGPTDESINESDTVMRALEREADISTRYGGDFVRAIDGVAEDVREGEPYDWFFYVNGVESGVGAADYPLHAGDAVWWDYRDWAVTISVPAVVGSWPQPFADGSGGRGPGVRLQCLGGGRACMTARQRLRSAGARFATRADGEAPRVLVGPWGLLRADPAAAQIGDGPRRSGVYAQLVRTGRGYSLRGLDPSGATARAFGPAAGLVAATRLHEAPPVWVVTGTTGAGVAAAAALLDTGDLRDHYAVAVEGGRETPLPIE